MKFCQGCGQENASDASKCSACGVALPADARPGTRTRIRNEQDAPGAAGLMVDPNLWRVKRAGSDSVRRRASSAVQLERHYLVPAIGAPLRLEVRSEPYVIGREDECDVVVASPQVSRRHCSLTFRESPPRAFLKDLGTRNGTFLNGSPVSVESYLQDGDVIGLSDVTATYRRLQPGADESSLQAKAGGSNATAPALARESVVEGLTGDLALFPVAQLLLNLTRFRATGNLVIEADGATHRLAFSQGNPTDKVTFDRISALERGKFRFESVKK